MFSRIRRAVEALKQEVAGFDPALVRPTDAAELLKLYSEGEKLCAAGKAYAAERVASGGAWRGQGDRSPAHFVARATGDSVGTSVAAIETARRMAELPHANQAFRSGGLTFAQAAEVASAASVAPGKERELVSVAKSEGIVGLRQECRKVIAQACPDEAERAERLHRSRFLRSWCDSEGAFRLDARLAPEAGAQVGAALDHYREEVFEQARRSGIKESTQALDADALVQMSKVAVGGKGREGGPRAVVNVRVDHAALVRGHTKDGEVCEVAGVGPVPVAAARACLSDSILNLLVRKGTSIQAVAHLGRTIPAKLRTALVDAYPECAIRGCHETKGLEIDHVIPLYEGGPTSMANLWRICRHHHRLKTYRGYSLVKDEETWALVPPNGRARASPG